jgi:hypothetical protein
MPGGTVTKEKARLRDKDHVLATVVEQSFRPLLFVNPMIDAY